MKKALLSLIVLAALLCLLAGCQILIPAAPPTTAAPTQTAAPAPATTAAPQTQAPATEAPQTEAPATEAPRTEPPATLPPATEPAPEPEPERFYVRDGEVFTNGVLEFRLQDGAILCRELASGTERALFAPEQPADTTLELIGVTDERLYFGWNEVEDWWGVDVYSVDRAGQDRQELGQYWDPVFRDGWLLLYGFRSDVSPTELRVIDRRDRIVIDEPLGAVWSGEFFDGSFYYVHIKDLPENWEEQYAMTDVCYEIIRLDPDNSSTVLSSFRFDSFYHPAFIDQEGKVNFYDEASGSSFSYDLFGN